MNGFRRDLRGIEPYRHIVRYPGLFEREDERFLRIDCDIRGDSVSLPIFATLDVVGAPNRHPDVEMVIQGPASAEVICARRRLADQNGPPGRLQCQCEMLR